MAYKSITEISKEVKEKLKKEFPDLEFSVTKESYAGGQSLTVRWMKGFNPFVSQELLEEGYIQINDKYIQDDKRLTQEAKDVLERVNIIANEDNWDKSDRMTDYFYVNYYFHLTIGRWDKKYEVTEAKPKKSSSSFGRKPSGEKPKFDNGDKITECGGWEIYKKTLPDGRIVNSAIKMNDTPLNKADWATIKGEIYTETGWKWSKWGKFERWGTISDEKENIEKLCSILRKYYVQDQKPKEGDYSQEELRNLISTLRKLEANGNEFAKKQANVLSLLIK